MKIVTTRRIVQIFFLLLFLWFCVVSSVGDQWWQLRGWPVNWFLELDPLAALGTILTSWTLYKGMLWGLLTIVMTFFLGRVFCGWICPFGTLHQGIGYLSRYTKKFKDRIRMNRPHRAQRIKYYILILFLISAAAPLLLRPFGLAEKFASLQTGLLDPIPFLYRSVNLTLLPLLDRAAGVMSVQPRYYEGAGVIGFLFALFLGLNILVPRFYCRFICPLGALLGLCSRVTVWRIGKTEDACSHCKRCEEHCEGACDPDGAIQTPECVMCMNCIPICPDKVVTYSPAPSASGEVLSPDLSRRSFITSAIAGAGAVPLLRLKGLLSFNWNSRLIRPPGSLREDQFLAKCLKCGQCMRVCPTNIIEPSTEEFGAERLWTPVLNFRTGTSGCQLNCIACGQICPTAAIRPVTLDEKLGAGDFQDKGPLRMGTAFIERGRCLPWAMDKPCIVCQENCPVSPKAIFIREEYRTVRDGAVQGKWTGTNQMLLLDKTYQPGELASGDFYIREKGSETVLRIKSNEWQTLMLEDAAEEPALNEKLDLEIVIKLQLPFVDTRYCIGCGICEHECPVSGKRAIRVYAENESRDKEHSLLL